MPLAPSIFKACDIRGSTPATLNEAVAEALGLAFGTQARALGGHALFGEDIQALRRMMEGGGGQHRAGGSVRAHDVWPAYRDRIAGDIRLARPIKLVLDCGNGVAGAAH